MSILGGTFAVVWFLAPWFGKFFFIWLLILFSLLILSGNFSSLVLALLNANLCFFLFSYRLQLLT